MNYEYRVLILLRNLIKRVNERYRNVKRQRGAIDFDDILLETKKALKNHPEIAREENENISYLLIDEFQDVDPVQFEIFSALLGENFGNKLVAFGDPKQSIYGFRGADVSIFNELNRDEK
jgi:ATP-dependent exoDNAse (exonuclease V) beta subunit (contains helicase and exonuclease domains)